MLDVIDFPGLMRRNLEVKAFSLKRNSKYIAKYASEQDPHHQHFTLTLIVVGAYRNGESTPIHSLVPLEIKHDCTGS